ncbi:MAG TPA: hypothetical protein V6C99_07595 [Oculatellaceae cyanobacterium]|jgi:hypothetical protein
MVEQHHYEINLRQGSLYISLSSDDLYFISKQMDKWCRVLMDDSYIPITIPDAHPKTVAPAATPQPAMAQPQPPISEPVAVQTVLQQQAPEPQPIPQPIATQPQPGPSMPPAATVVQPAFTEPASVPQPSTPVAAKPPEDVVIDSLLKEFEDPVPEAPASAAAGSGPDLAGVTSLPDLCDRARAESSEDFLLLSAFYLSQFEGEERFSLKRINAMLVRSGLTPVNHSVLEAALRAGTLSMVPDLSGMAEVSEYTLTEEGYQAVRRLF